jgi:FKBP-type peptidyl-prolyl cis-trans isomerase
VLGKTGWTAFLLIAGAVLVMVRCGPGEPEAICARAPVTSETGLTFRDLECGDGEVAARGDSLLVEYSARLENGEQFDSTRSRGEPVRFRLGVGQIVSGLDEGLEGMQVGGTRRLTLPPELAYGQAGLAPDVPPGATVIYDVELLSLREPEE